jgi:hypothetical protein
LDLKTDNVFAFNSAIYVSHQKLFKLVWKQYLDAFELDILERVGFLVSFNDGGNWSTRRKTKVNRKTISALLIPRSLTNLYYKRTPEEWFPLQ